MMELYLVKEEVKVADVASAFSMTKDYNEYVSRLVRRANPRRGYESESEEESQEEDDRDRVFLKMTNFPVALKSICSENEKSKHSEEFAKRIERKLLPEGVHEFGNLDMNLIICDRSNSDSQSDSLDGYLLISGFNDGSKTDILKRLKEEYNENDGDENIGFKVEVSLGHLPTGNPAVSPPSSVITLKPPVMDFRLHHNHVRCPFGVRVPAEVKEWWEQGTGFMYAKLTVKITFSFSGVDRVYECSDNKQDLLHAPKFKDVEISCKDGKVVKCHRSILAAKSRVFHDKFEEMPKDDKSGPWELEMEMSKKGVKALLGYIYCDYVSGGLESCDLALELLKVGPKYGVWGLQEKMEEIIMAKGSSDFEYFSVKGALNLFLYAREDNVLKHLRDKAVRVLRNYLRTESVKDQLLGYEEYKEMLRDPVVGMEINTLYAQLKN